MRVKISDINMYGRRIRYVIYEGSDKDNVIFFFHGIGETGSNSRRVLKHGPLSSQTRRFWCNFGYTIIYPMCPLLQWWDTQSMKEFIDSFDYKRVHLSGVSMGAFLVWSLISTYPTEFVSAVPVSGAANPMKLIISGLFHWKPVSVQLLPTCTTNIWAFHGRNDPLVPISECVKLINTVPNGKLTVYNELGHQKTMIRAFSELDILNWLKNS